MGRQGADAEKPLGDGSAQTAAAGNALHFRDVSVKFGENPALVNINLEVARGEFLVCVGKSGGGKTTLLNLAAGLVKPTSGEVQVLGGDVEDRRQVLGYMFARDALLPWRTAQRNVEYPLQLRGMPKSERAKIAKQELARVHLAGQEAKWPWQLSQGMRQRVALARTWAPSPDVLLMDEPFAALDAQTRTLIRKDFLDQWRASKKTVLFVTHDLAEAAILGQRILVIDGGIVAEIRPRHPQAANEYELSHNTDFQDCLQQLNDLIWGGGVGEEEA